MMYRGLDTERVTGINFLDLKNYLIAKNWGFNQIDGLQLYVFKKDNAEIVISNDLDLSDRQRRIIDALKLIEEIEKKPVEEVVLDISLTAMDVIRFRLGGSMITDGTIPMESGIDLVKGGRKALLASACFASDPKKYHRRLQRSDAESFLNSCRMGQTENRSYVVTFLCPVNLGDEVGEHAVDPKLGSFGSYSRSVTGTLLNSVNNLISLITQNSLEELDKSETPSLNGNLCEALLQMLPSQYGSSFLEISAAWSPKLTPPKVTNRVSITNDYYDGIERIAQKLRPQFSPQVTSIIARVDNLNGKPDADGKVQGDVVLVFVDESNELVRAHVNLDANAYQKALQAHGAAQHLALRGVLHRGAGRKTSIIRDPSAVEIHTQ